MKKLYIIHHQSGRKNWLTLSRLKHPIVDEDILGHFPFNTPGSDIRTVAVEWYGASPDCEFEWVFEYDRSVPK